MMIRVIKKGIVVIGLMALCVQPGAAQPRLAQSEVYLDCRDRCGETYNFCIWLAGKLGLDASVNTPAANLCLNNFITCDVNCYWATQPTI
jgi:hypothetical protein